MLGITSRNKMKKNVQIIIEKAFSDTVEGFFDEVKKYQKSAEKIPKQDQEKYHEYFKKYMNHEINLKEIEHRKIDMSYKESVLKTSKFVERYIQKLADKSLNKEMRFFYQQEYLNSLKPMYFLEQVKENHKQYLEVLGIIHEEFNEWFFMGNFDFLKGLLKPYIVIEKGSKNKEIWIYNRYKKELTKERLERMFNAVGLKAKS